jgi:hypothetical protein
MCSLMAMYMVQTVPCSDQEITLLLLTHNSARSYNCME